DGADQVGALVGHVRPVGRRPAQPRVLDDVLGVGDAAEHLVRDAEEQPPVPVERRLLARRRHRTACTRAAGISQRSLKPWLVSPSAPLNRERRFSTAIIMVSSTSAASSRCSRSPATISSVTAGGVAVAASAYSSTRRSRSV